MNIFNKLKRAVDPRTKTVTADMKRLNAVQSGLDQKAIDYIIDGKHETVLSTLSNGCTGSELEVCKTYLDHNSATRSRRQLLAQHAPYDVEFANRYTEVLSASLKDIPDNCAGSSKASRLVRVFFSEVFEGIKKSINTWPAQPEKIRESGLTLATAQDITLSFGGTLVDLVDVLFHENGQWSSITGDLYRQAIDVKPLLKTYPKETIDAGRRIHAISRSNLIQELHRCGLADTPDYRDFIVELAGDNSKAVREAAISLISTFDTGYLEPKAIELLDKGNVSMRAGMVELLAKLGTEQALQALHSHKEKEKTARIVAAIDAAMTVSKHVKTESPDSDNNKQYQAIDGTVVEIPELGTIPDGDNPKFGQDDRIHLVKIIQEENNRIKKQNEENKKSGYSYRLPLLKENLSDTALAFFNQAGRPNNKANQALINFLSRGSGEQWARNALAKLPQKTALRLAVKTTQSAYAALSPYGQGPFVDIIRDFINGPNGDLRNLEAIDVEMESENWFGYGSNRITRNVQAGDLLRSVIQDDYAYMEPNLDNVPSDAVWPYLAQSFDVIDEAFGLKPQTDIKLSRVGAIKVLYRLPKTPSRYFGQLLEAATGETKAGRAEAREMLANAPAVDDHILALLNDSRQAVRAGAAEWIAARHYVEGIPALKARLKKEKSEVTKAALLTTLDALGEDLSGFVGPKALLEEAEAGLKKAKLDKLAWLNLDHLPKLRYPSNRAVPNEVLKWWIFLAVKLKQPGGNALFDIYLDRLNPQDAEHFSTWILDSWYNYDTEQPSEQEGNAYAKQNATNRYNSMKKWYKEYTEEKAYADLKREFMSNYLNSGAATKGLLALASHTPATLAADRVRNFLKNHGSRTSQASALLEMLAHKGDPVSLQVVIAAATRLKQKGVQKFAATLIEKVAEAKSWSLDELADRTVPSAGLDDDGILRLPCGPDHKIYAASIGDSFIFEIRNPDGKVVKSLPSGQDDTTKESKKQLSTSRRELKQVISMQSSRLYEALCAERSWRLEDWQRDIGGHPIMRRLAERSVRLGLDDSENVVTAFRPTQEGDYTDANDQDIDIESFSSIRLAHGALIEASETEAWQRHLDDYEVKPLFEQFTRPLLSIDKEQASMTIIEDRKGWITDTFTFRGEASKLGYERGEAMDGGYFNEYKKNFQSAGILAIIEFSGN
ncbi:MAG: DUF4132 domain-containing protein, partial [Candidatus Thiodiazotropha sp. 6PLUC3]